MRFPFTLIRFCLLCFPIVFVFASGSSLPTPTRADEPVAGSVAAPVAQEFVDPAAEVAADWTKLFDRTEIWLGGDGIFSIPLDAHDVLGGASENTRTLFVFSDSMVGSADPVTKSFKDAAMVNHSVAILEGNTPDSGRIRFIYGRGGDMSRTNLFGVNCWLQDGIVLDGTLYLTALRTGKNWKPFAVDLIRVPLEDGIPNWKRFEREEHFPIMVGDEIAQSCFGAGILDRSAADGYVYVYGYRDRLKGSRKGLIAARVRPDRFSQASQWRYWNGTRWTEDLRETLSENAVLADDVSTELSVTPLDEDRFILVYTHAVMSPEVRYALGGSPIGPFGTSECVYRCPEPDEPIEESDDEKSGSTPRGRIYTYNAKAHPHLSPPGMLLISYNVNRFASLPRKTYEYHPRFVTLPLRDIARKFPPANSPP